MPPKRRRAPAPQAPDSEEQVFDIISISSSPEPQPPRDTSPAVVTGTRVSASRRRAPGQRTRGVGSGGGSLRRSSRRAQEPDAPSRAVTERVGEDSQRGWESNAKAGKVAKRRRVGEQVVVVSDDEEEGEKNVPLSPKNDNQDEPDVGDGAAPEGLEPDEEGDEEGSEYDSDDDSDDESDIAWEDVDLGAKPMNIQDILHHGPAPAPPAALDLTLNHPATLKSSRTHRKITAVDRRIRLETHKLHLICLLYHVNFRNLWCNDPAVISSLPDVIPKKALEKLHHDPADQQFRRSKFFVDGLRETAQAFCRKWLINHQGLTAPRWRDLDELRKWKPPPGTELISKEDFILAASTLAGSRDLGAQIFCALLRASGITTRLVCSLQVLPFTFASKKKPFPDIITISDSDSVISPVPAPSPTRTSKSSNLRRPPIRLPPSASKPRPPAPTKSVPEPLQISESPYPIYWTEAWSSSAQRWITVDPFNPSNTAKPTALEPPLSDPLNTLTYAIAFEETSHAADVTRRYSSHLTSKTRRHRVTSTKDGQRWFSRLLRHNFSRGFPLDRDQLETSKFALLDLQEPIPNSIQDLKDHPVFALKRHLRRGEVIFPERRTGTVKVKGKVEPIFRRQDVKEVKTRDGWYKLGRVVRDGEVPMKFTAPPRRLRRRDNDKEEEEEERPHQPMFAITQSDVYIPPPVTNGLVPKNRFGNLDVFVPSMVPAGGVHIPHVLARRAAQLVGVDCADVVTGFEFRNRVATPVVKGVVVAAEFAEAVEAVVEGFENEVEREMEEERMWRALERWRRWLLRLRIRERLGVGRDELPEIRIPEEALGGRAGNAVGWRRVRGGRRRKESDEEEEEEAAAAEDEEDEGVYGGGGFVPEGDDGHEEGGFLPEDGYGGGFLPEDDHGGGFLPDAEPEGGGFIPEESDTGGGGFIPEEDSGGGVLPDSSNDEAGGYIPDPTGRHTPDDKIAGGFIPEDTAKRTEVREATEPGPTPPSSQGVAEEDEDEDEEPDWDLLGL